MGENCLYRRHFNAADLDYIESIGSIHQKVSSPWTDKNAPEYQFKYHGKRQKNG